MKTPMAKLMLAAIAALSICLGAKAAEIDISTISSSGYTACDGDVFYGTQSNRYPIDIPDGVTVTLAGINYSDTIHCMGDAVIILKEDTENVIRPGNPWPAIELWNYGKTLTIRGEGKLLAYGNGHNAGIGPCSPDHGWNRGEGGNIVIEGGDITAEGGAGGAGIGASANNNCGNITIRGGKVMATGHSACGIGNSASGTCGDLTIEGTIEKVVVTGATAGTGVEIASGGALTIGSEDHKLIWWSDDDVTCTIGPKGSPTVPVASPGTLTLSGETITIWVDDGDTKPITVGAGEVVDITATGDGTIITSVFFPIAWLNDEGVEIGTTFVFNGEMPTHADPTKEADVPYRYVFTGWTPALEPAVSNTTYTATFKKIADLSLATNDWTAADGDVITNATAHAITIPAGASVTVNGMVVKAASGGTTPTPTFTDGGKAAMTEFTQGEGGKWTLTTFAELSNDALGANVTDGQIKVYAADTVEGLESASPMTSGVTVTEKKSAVKTTIEVTPPSAAPAQFFKVKFGE